MEGGLELHDHAEGIILNFIFLQTLSADRAPGDLQHDKDLVNNNF